MKTKIEQLSCAGQDTQPSDKLLTIQEAAVWAAKRANRNVTVSNISYLIQYGRVRKIVNNGNTCVSVRDLENYYDSYNPNFPEPYKSWQMRGMLGLDEVLVEKEFWDFLGGEGAYEELLGCFERAGNDMREVIDDYFKRFNV